MADWIFLVVEKVGMGEMCMANSSSCGDNIYFMGCAGGRSLFPYGFFLICYQRFSPIAIATDG